MAPHAMTKDERNGDVEEKRSNVNVLVTGFGPFQDRYPVNPSFEITRSLPSKISTTRRDIHIIGYGVPIRVCYDGVRDLVPLMHESYLGSIDLVLHIGMASGRDFYTTEIYGHRDGYTKNKDLDGKTLPEGHGLAHFGDCPAIMTTSLDCDHVLRRWKENLIDLPESQLGHGADCRASEDAGRYLCDYIYFNSLAWYGRRHERLDGGKASDRPVLFLHVPATSDPDALEKGRQVAVALIEAMVEDWCRSLSSATA